MLAIKKGMIIESTHGILKGVEFEVIRVGRKYADTKSVKDGNVYKNIELEYLSKNSKLVQ